MISVNESLQLTIRRRTKHCQLSRARLRLTSGGNFRRCCAHPNTNDYSVTLMNEPRLFYVYLITKTFLTPAKTQREHTMKNDDFHLNYSDFQSIK